jgi:GAF domain-containing protein
MDTRDPVRFLQTEVGRLRDENRELKDEVTVLRSSVRGLAALQDLIQRMQPRANVMALLDDLLASALAVLDTRDGSLLLVDEDTGELVFAVVHGQSRGRLTGYRLAKGQGIAGWVAENRKPLIVADARQDPRFSPIVDETFGFRTSSLACVPLLDGQRVLGVIEAVNKTSGREFTLEDNDLLVVVAQLVSVAIVRAEAFTETPSAT